MSMVLTGQLTYCCHGRGCSEGQIRRSFATPGWTSVPYGCTSRQTPRVEVSSCVSVLCIPVFLAENSKPAVFTAFRNLPTYFEYFYIALDSDLLVCL